MELSKLIHQSNYLFPELFLLLCGIFVLILELTNQKSKNNLNFMLSLVFFFVVMGILGTQVYTRLNTKAAEIFSNAYLITPSITFGKIIILMAGFLTLLASRHYAESQGINLSEYICYLALSVLGMFVLLSANDFIVLFLGLELLSFPIYILTGMKVHNERSCEASLKYIVMGAFSSGLLVFGIATIYGATGNTNLSQFAEQTLSVMGTKTLASAQEGMIVLGMILVLVGLAFKLSLFPFHAWTPDVYEGAPTPVTAFMSVAIKVSVFLVFLRLFRSVTAVNVPHFLDIIAGIALLSVVVGNFYALIQENLKRLIAYSSIAHAGYIMMAFLDPNNRGESEYAMVFYLLNYTFMNLAALFILVYLTTKEKYVENISDLQGLGWKRPCLGFIMMVAMFSLAGLPPTPGFIAKFYVFKSAIQGGYILTVVFALLATLVSLYYYAKILVVMYMEDKSVEVAEKGYSFSVGLTMSIAILVLFYMGIFPNHILNFLSQSF